MRREQVAMIWIGGLVLAVALYVVGPDRFIDACWDLIDTIDDGFRALVAQLGAQTYGVVRALDNGGQVGGGDFGPAAFAAFLRRL